ncbi:MAG TPA: NACHT domain-containing protein [Paenibacillus sp.]|uniref:serine protease n=1 Tax=Paenibacillus TaxID=44249 RepID=UPI000BA01054|nr:MULTISPECIES: serine protease [Paenibacillus]OZQ61268.1 hypothetical protein CA599_28565 [Paenibacillus taichungensis]HBU80448.1 NACHT domain-containing protein [Paenibacillus sp.]
MDTSIQRSIPKVNCGNHSGTAFLVGNNKAITATHVINDYIERNDEIELIFKGSNGKDEVKINAVPIISDVCTTSIVVLQLDRELHGYELLPCVDYKFSSVVSCVCFGYPPARFNEGTFSNLRLINENYLGEKDWNLDLKIEDDIKDYKGVSGAPLIYKGNVVAVIQRQVTERGEATRLSAVSLFHFKEYLSSFGITLDKYENSLIYKDYLEGLEKELEIKLDNSINRLVTKNNTLGLPIRLSSDLVDAYNNEDNSSCSFKELLNLNGSAIVLSEAGGGKTFLLNMLAKECIVNYLPEEERVPILLSAKHWGISFSSLYEGIYNELIPYYPDIHLEEVMKEFQKGKFLLLVDGLDEVTSSHTTLIEDLLKKSRMKNAKIILSCRVEKYYDQLKPLFKIFTLQSLKSEQIIQYIKKVLGEDAPPLLRDIDDNLLALMKNPMYLSMVIIILKQTKKRIMSKNVSELYSTFSRYLLSGRLLEKGQFHHLKIDETLKLRILATYANKTFRTFGDIYILNECIEEVVPSELANAKKEIIDSGLVLQKGNQIEFYHPSIEEYFMALYISNLSSKEIYSVVREKCKMVEYYEVFKYLTGLLRLVEKQNIVFDILEDENLYLYNKCLDTRFDFSEQVESNSTINYAELYFSQVRKSYLKIINNFFPLIKSKMSPWNQLDDNLDPNDFDVIIYGSLDKTIPSISYILKVVTNDSKQPRIVINDFRGGVTASIKDLNGNENYMDIVSSSFGYSMYKNLKFSNLGIDSAREMAIQIIKEQLKNIIDNRSLIEFEPKILIFEFLEGVLNQIWDNNLKLDGKKLSLYKHSIQDISNILLSTKGIEYGQRTSKYNSNKGRDYFQALVMLNEFKDKTISVIECLPPKSDISEEKLIKKTTLYTWELWSDEQLCNLLVFVFDNLQIIYRNLVESLFAELKNHMPYYRIGPMRYIITLCKGEEISSGATVEVNFLPVPQGMDTKTEVKVALNDSIEEKDISAEIIQKLLQLNRPIYYFSESSWIGNYISENEVIRKKVYNKLKNDIQYIFGKL